MSLRIKKLIFLVLFNMTLFLILIIGIQNSTKSKKVNFIISETINLPISFIIGLSFISGSFTASLLALNLEQDKE